MNMETQQVTLLIEKLNKHWNRAVSNKKLSRIDKDILIEDIRQLYELVHELQTGNHDHRKNGKAQGMETAMETDDNLPLDKPKEKPAAEEESKPEGIQELDMMTDDNPDDSKDQEQQKQNPDEVTLEVTGLKETEVEGKSGKQYDEANDETPDITSAGNHQAEKPGRESPQFTSDKFKASTTLADVYQKNGDISFAARMQKNRITDLKPAIGINDKFLFINEIFKGKTADYELALGKMNQMNHYQEAVEYLEKIMDENDVQNREAGGRLVEFLKRRFQ